MLRSRNLISNNMPLSFVTNCSNVQLCLSVVLSNDNCHMSICSNVYRCAIVTCQSVIIYNNMFSSLVNQ